MKTKLRTSIFIVVLGSAACALLAQDPPPRPAAPGERFEPPRHPLPYTERPTQLRRAPGGPVERRAVNVFANDLGPERFGRPLIVKTSKSNGSVMTQLQEDLAVMSRVLDKAAGERTDDDPNNMAAGIAILALSGGRAPRAIYLEDYGVLFTVRVNIPLRGEPKSPDEEAAREKQPTNEEWEEARNEVFGSRRFWRGEDRIARKEFDPKEIEDLAESLIRALKNAANIRNLKESDWVTVLVCGRGPESPDPLAPLFDARVGERDRLVFSLGEARGESTMILRARKSDVDEFAQKKLTFEQFRKKVAVASY